MILDFANDKKFVFIFLFTLEVEFFGKMMVKSQ